MGAAGAPHFARNKAIGCSVSHWPPFVLVILSFQSAIFPIGIETERAIEARATFTVFPRTSTASIEIPLALT